MATVDVFGTVHVDRLSKVTDELDSFAADADVFFVEGPSDDYSSWRFFLRNPATWLAGVLLDIIWGLIGLILTRRAMPVDGVATDIIAERYDIPLEPVDMNIPHWLSNVHPMISLGSWVWFALSMHALGIGLLSLSFDGVLRGIAFGFVPVVLFALVSLSDRDEEMAQHISEYLALLKPSETDITGV